MKSGVRLLLIVALLLPFRGALAIAGGFCHVLPLPEAVATDDRQASAASHGAGHVAHVHHGHDAPISENGHALPAVDAACNLCSAICGAPPLPGTTVSVPALLPTGAERFPALDPPRVFRSYGAPERPPRAV